MGKLFSMKPVPGAKMTGNDWYNTLTKRPHLLRDVFLEMHQPTRCAFGPPQNTFPFQIKGGKDSEGTIPISDKDTARENIKDI